MGALGHFWESGSVWRPSTPGSATVAVFTQNMKLWPLVWFFPPGEVLTCVSNLLFTRNKTQLGVRPHLHLTFLHEEKRSQLSRTVHQCRRGIRLPQVPAGIPGTTRKRATPVGKRLQLLLACRDWPSQWGEELHHLCGCPICPWVMRYAFPWAWSLTPRIN